MEVVDGHADDESVDYKEEDPHSHSALNAHWAEHSLQYVEQYRVCAAFNRSLQGDLFRNRLQFSFLLWATES